MEEQTQDQPTAAVPGEVELQAGPTLASTVAEAMAAASQVHKERENTDQGYKFASAEAILGAVRGPLLERGVMLFPSVDNVEEVEITSRNGAKGNRVKLHVSFMFTDGREQLVANWRGEGQDYGDKAYGKAYTNAVKTFIRTAWLLPTEHDDPEASSPGERIPNEAPAWQREVTKARYDELWELLVARLGENTASAFVQGIGQSWTYLPDGVVAIVKALAPHIPILDDVHPLEAPAAIADDPAAVEPLLDDSPDDTPPAGSIDAPTDLPKDPALATGTLKAAGCTCEDPLGVRGTPTHDELCPIKGHGIPF